LVTSTAAQPQSAGDFVAGFGWFHLAPQDWSTPLTVSALRTSVTEAGTGATVDDSDTFGLTATYFFTDHIAATAVLGVPPKLNLTGTGSLAALIKRRSFEFANLWNRAGGDDYREVEQLVCTGHQCGLRL
jgi:outer membrane protein